jgi:hypothetical protein
MTINNKQKEIRFRVDDLEKNIIERKTKEHNFLSVSEYVRFVSLHCDKIQISIVHNGAENVR